MGRFAIVFSMIWAGTVQAQDFDAHIVGGKEAAKEGHSFVVAIETTGRSFFCGGSLIAPTWVLTAAHCAEALRSVSQFRVVIGLHKLSDTKNVEVKTLKAIYRHPNRIAGSDDFDFALLELKTASKFAPIALNSEEVNVPDQEGNAPNATVNGWGTTRESGSTSSVLRTVDLPLVTRAHCEQAYPGEISDRMMCAGYIQGGKDSCQGDSGGPLFMTLDGERKLVGVVGWGEGCARPGKFGVYGKVRTVLDWIHARVPNLR